MPEQRQTRPALRLDSVGRFVGTRRTLPAWAIFVVVFIVSGVISPFFLKPANLFNVLDAAVVLMLVAIGQTFMLVVAEIDLSVGALISVVAVISTGMMNGRDSMIVPTVVAMIALCLVIACINAVVTLKLRVPSFLATLGMMYMLQGVALVITPKPAGQAAPAFAGMANWNIGGFPVSVIGVAVIVGLAMLMLRRTVFGRHVYAVGGDAEVARLSGIKVNRVKLRTFLVCGLATGLTGLYVASRTTVGDPNVGNGYELASIAAVVIGGTSLFGGRGGLFGTVAGVLILATLTNVLNLQDVNSYTQLMIRGAIIIAVVSSYTKRTPSAVTVNEATHVVRQEAGSAGAA